METILKLESGLQDAQELLTIASGEANSSAVAEIERDIVEYRIQVEKLEFQRMFTDKLAVNNAYVDIQSGAGGTEAQDWTEMLKRMYLRWGMHNNFHTEILDLMPGDVAGIKSITMKFTGPYAFGWLRTETGVHRLVRKSPFSLMQAIVVIHHLHLYLYRRN